jgi:hypothetical protein
MPVVRMSGGVMYHREVGGAFYAPPGSILVEEHVAEGELDRLSELGAFDEPPEPEEVGPHAPSPEEEQQFAPSPEAVPTPTSPEDVDELTDDELAEWMGTRPTVSEVVRLADEDPGRAQRLLAAENTATGDDPRTTLKQQLEAMGEG